MLNVHGDSSFRLIDEPMDNRSTYHCGPFNLVINCDEPPSVSAQADKLKIDQSALDRATEEEPCTKIPNTHC